MQFAQLHLNNICLLLQCDGSVSSGSLGGRSLSPVHSDESSASPPPPPPSRPIRKRRPAPKPPTINNKQMVSC